MSNGDHTYGNRLKLESSPAIVEPEFIRNSTEYTNIEINPSGESWGREQGRSTTCLQEVGNQKQIWQSCDTQEDGQQLPATTRCQDALSKPTGWRPYLDVEGRNLEFHLDNRGIQYTCDQERQCLKNSVTGIKRSARQRFLECLQGNEMPTSQVKMEEDFPSETSTPCSIIVPQEREDDVSFVSAYDSVEETSINNPLRRGTDDEGSGRTPFDLSMASAEPPTGPEDSKLAEAESGERRGGRRRRRGGMSPETKRQRNRQAAARAREKKLRELREVEAMLEANQARLGTALQREAACQQNYAQWYQALAAHLAECPLPRDEIFQFHEIVQTLIRQ